MGIPSKGRMAELTLELLQVRSGPHAHILYRPRGWLPTPFVARLPAQDCQLGVKKVNDRQYVANIPNVRHSSGESPPCRLWRARAHKGHASLLDQRSR